MKRKKLLCIVMSLLVSLCNIPLTTVQAQEDLGTLPEQETIKTDEMEDLKMSVREITPQTGRVRAVNSIGEEYEYRELQDGTVEITSYQGDETELVIPAEIDGKRVSSIGAYAFQYCRDLMTIELSDNIIGIGNGAFDNCISLTSVKFAAGLTRIGSDAFSGCRSLTDVELPASLTSIGGGAFSGCRSLIAVVLPAGLTSIGYIAFLHCSSLTEITIDSSNAVYASQDGILYDKKKEKLICCPQGKTGNITIPESVINIEPRAFEGCSNLTGIEFPAGFTSIGDYIFSFSYCSSLTEITVDSNNSVYASQDGILYDKKKEKLIRCPQGKTGTISISQTVTSIENGAFSGCSSLTGITVDNNNPTYISQDGLLYDKVKKTLIRCPEGKTGTITIPQMVTRIENGAFSGCSSLAGITVDNNNSVYASQDGILYDKKKEKLIHCPQGIKGNITVPESVISIEEHAFWYRSSLTGIELPDNITRIGDSAFMGCSSLTEIKLPAGLTSIGNHVFCVCDSLTEIELPTGLTSIGNSAFLGCSSLTWIELPDNITTIGTDAFFDCSSLTEIELPTALTSIGRNAFRFCSGLTEIELPTGLTSIGNYAFRDCKNLTLFVTKGSYAETYATDHRLKYDYIDNYNMWEGYRYRKRKDGTVEIIYYQGNDTELVIPSEINEKRVTGIKDSAFMGGSLTKVTLPDSITSIGDSAFSGCSSLTEITIDSNNPVYTSQDGMLYDKKKQRLIFCPKGKTGIATIPESVTSIEERAFWGCTNLTKITLPDSITNIGESTFWGCLNMTGIELPAGLTSIGNFAFQHCNNLKDIELPAGLTSIGDSAFWNCINLTITLPAGLTSIGDSAFKNCMKVTGIELPASLTSIGNSAFSGCSSLTGITVDSNNPAYTSQDGILYDKKKKRLICCPKGKTGTATIPESVTSIEENAFDDWGKLTFLVSKGSYRGLKDGTFEFIGYQGDDTKFAVPDKICGRRVTYISNNAFRNCSSLTEIKLPNSITSIGDAAFSGCSSLTGIKLPTGLTSIGDNVFSGCSSLTGIELPVGITSIGSRAFYECKNLAGIELPAGLTSIGDYTFSGCSGLTGIELPNSITNIESSAFSDCSNLAEIKLPAGLTSIENSVFSGCSSLTGIELPAGITSIGSRAFYECKNLAGIELPAGLTSIGDYTFSGCSSLTGIELPAGITSIGYSVFGGCSSLTRVELSADLTSIGDSAFSNCSSLTGIELPAGLTSIGGGAFSGCDSLARIELPASLTSIGFRAFSECKSLIEINIDSNNPTYASQDGLLYDKKKEKLIYCPGGKTGTATIPESVSSIEPWAFYSCILTGIELPAGLTSIGTQAFYKCTNLTGIKLPASLTSIGDHAFYGCSSLTGIELPTGLTSIGVYALSNCSTLMEITVDSNNPTYASQDGLLYDKKKETLICCPGGKTGTVTISENVTNIEKNAFSGCSSLAEITVDGNNSTYASQDGLLYDKKKEKLICCPEGKTGTVIIPESVSSIENNAFSSCSNLKGIELPAGLTSIGDRAFWNCLNLTRIELPTGLTSIGNSVFTKCNLTRIELPASLSSISSQTFSGCNSLTEITVDSNNPTYASQDGLLYDKKKEKLIYCPEGKTGTVTIPESVISINSLAFSGVIDFMLLVSKGSYAETYAKNHGFKYDYIEDCNIWEGYTYRKLKDNTVELINYNTNDIKFVVPFEIDGKHVTGIGSYTFSFCNNLTTITIPESVISIAKDAFGGCNSLTEIVVDNNNPTYTSQDGVLYDKKKETLICCPEGKTGTITIPESVTNIEENAFLGCKDLTLLVVKGTYVEEYAKNHNLKINYISDSNTWEGFVFKKLKDGTVELTGYEGKDTELVIPAEIDGKLVTCIGAAAFSGCSNLTAITIPESIISIAKDTFLGCNSLTRITVDSNNPTYASQDDVLYDKKKETLICCPKGKTGSITIPESVTSIAENAFSGCKDLTLLVSKGSYAEQYAKEHDLKINYISDSNTWEGFIFKKLKDGTVELTGYEGKDTELVIPAEIDGKLVTCIGAVAFSGCSNLTAIKIPESVTSIAKDAFLGCNSLTRITIDSNNPTYASQDDVLYDKKKETLICCPKGKTGNITIPESVTSIAENAFSGCKDLTLLVSKGSYAEQYAKEHDLKNNYIDDCTHDWETVIVKATTDKEGRITKTCTKCGEQTTEIIYAAESIKLSETSCPYNGKKQEPSVIVKDSKGNILEHNTDYTVIYPKNMINVGSYTVTIELKGNYSGTVKKTFQIVPCSHAWNTVTERATTKKKGSITKTCTKCGEQTTEIIYAAKSVKLSKTSYSYNGKVQKPAVTIKNSKGKALKNNTDYTVTYPKNRKNVGSYTVTIKLKGKYRGTVKKTFQILPKGTTISKITPKKKGFTLKWKKQAVQTTGYEIAYSTNKNFTKKTTGTAVIGKNKTVSKSISKQKARKKYFVKIRTYKTVKVNGKSKKLYSAWSKVKTVTTKR